MPIIDQRVEEVFLDAVLSGDTASLPTTWQVALFADNPMLNIAAEVSNLTEVDDGLGGTTFEANGYARPTITTATAWAVAAEGLKRTATPVQFPDVTCDEGYSDTPGWWALYSPELAAWGPCAELTRPLEVTAAGPGPAVALTAFFADSITEE